MMNILTQKTVAEVIDEILVKNYAALPPSDFEKQLRIQISRKAALDTAFAEAFEDAAHYDGYAVPTDLDGIDEVITALPRGLEDLLDETGIYEQARTICNKLEAQDTNFFGYDMTEPQKALCDKVWDSVQSWQLVVPQELDIQSNLEDTYEELTGKSCVRWTDGGTSGNWRDTLPRCEDYTTNGYTDEFNDWAADKIAKAVAEAGCETHEEVAQYIKKICPVVRG